MAEDKELFGQPLHDLGATIPTLPDSDKRVAFEAIGQSGAANALWPEFKSITLAQGADRAAPSYFDADDDADMHLVTAGNSIALIDRTKVFAGGYVSMAVKVGVTVVHNFDKSTIPVGERPANYDNLCPILLSTGADYTTSKLYEPFDFRLVLDGADFLFLDWSRSTTVGSVEPDDYQGYKTLAGGAVVDSTSVIEGFTASELASIVVLTGGLEATDWEVTGSTITFSGLTGTKVVTSVTAVNAETVQVDFGTKEPFGVSPDKNRYFAVTNWAGEGFDNGGVYLQHANGVLEIDNIYIPNAAGGGKILEV